MVKKTPRRNKPEKPQLVDADFEKRLLRRKKSEVQEEDLELPTQMSAQEIKAERLAEALRENLRKRKEQARHRNDEGGAGDDSGDGET